MPHQHSSRSSRRSTRFRVGTACECGMIARLHIRAVAASHELCVLNTLLNSCQLSQCALGAVWKHRLAVAVCVVQVGLRKLLDAEGEVNVMKQELIALQPKLIETGTGVEDNDFRSIRVTSPLSVSGCSGSSGWVLCNPETGPVRAGSWQGKDKPP